MVVYETAKILKETKLETDDDNWHIGDFCLVTVPHLVIGSGSQVNAHTSILGRASVYIGRNSVVSYYCLLLTSSDTPRPPNRMHSDYAPDSKRLIRTGDIRIADNCFVGAHSTLMPSVLVPDDTVIPAYSYVDTRGGSLRIHSLKDIVSNLEGISPRT